MSTANLGLTKLVANQDNADITLGAGFDGFDSAIGSGAGNGYFIVPSALPVVFSSAVLGSANVVVVFRYWLRHWLLANSIVFYIATSSASKHMSVGLYSNDGNTLLIDSGPKSTSSTGVQTKTLTAPLALNPGPYWTAWTSDDTTAAIKAATISDAGIIAILNSGTVHMGTAANVSAAGQLPSTLGTITGSTQNAPIFKVQN